MATSRKSAKGMRKMNTAGELGGFTIIEVVLVLAIAGLIFLMVFLALPALQRSQRDTQRRSQLGELTTAITNYQTNNNGKLPNDGDFPAYDSADATVTYPDTWACSTSNGGATTTHPAQCLLINYINSVNAKENEFIDPDGTYYGITITSLGSGGSKVLNASDFSGVGDDLGHMVYIIKHALCEGEEAIYSANARDFVVMYKMEGSGTYCQDNHG